MSSQSFSRSYRDVVAATESLYPDPTQPRNHSTSWVFTHPPYQYSNAGFEIAVDRVEIEAGRRYQVVIRNRSKFDRRDTTIDIQAASDTRTDVRVESVTESFGFLSGTWEKGTDWQYQQARLKELQDYLK